MYSDFCPLMDWYGCGQCLPLKGTVTEKCTGQYPMCVCQQPLIKEKSGHVEPWSDVQPRNSYWASA